MYKKKITVSDIVSVFKGVSVNKLSTVNDYTINHCGHSDKNYTSLERYYYYKAKLKFVDDNAKLIAKAFTKGKISAEYFNSKNIFCIDYFSITVSNELPQIGMFETMLNDEILRYVDTYIW